MQEMLHTVSTRFDEDLALLRSSVLEMGGLIEAQITNVIAVYSSNDVSSIQLIIDADKKINVAEKRIDDECAHLIAKRQPAASDLRLIFGITKIVTDLERIGDETKRVAKLIRRIEKEGQAHSINLRHILDASHEMVLKALDSFARMDAPLAFSILQTDSAIDAEFKAIVRQLITHMMEDPRTISVAIDAIWMARAIERIGDHAQNIAEQVVFIVEGRDIRHQKSELAERGISQT